MYEEPKIEIPGDQRGKWADNTKKITLRKRCIPPHLDIELSPPVESFELCRTGYLLDRFESNQI